MLKQHCVCVSVGVFVCVYDMYVCVCVCVSEPMNDEMGVGFKHSLRANMLSLHLRVLLQCTPVLAAQVMIMNVQCLQLLFQ